MNAPPDEAPSSVTGPSASAEAEGAASENLSPPVLRPVSERVAELPEALGRRVDLVWSGGMVGLVAASFTLLTVFQGVAIPVLLSLATAYVLNPLVTAIERRGISRTVGVGLTFFVLALLTAGGVLYLIPVFREEAEKLPDFFHSASTQVLPRIEGWLGLPLPEFVQTRAAELGGEVSALMKSAGPATAKLLAAFAGNTARLLATVLGLLVVPVLAFFFLQDYPVLLEKARSLIPRRAVGLVSARFAAVDEVLSAFVRGQLTVGAILAAIYSVGLWAARLDLAIVIGVIAGFGNMVPYLGTGLGVVLACVALVLSWQGPWQLLVVGLTFVVGQVLEGLVITPRIVGDKVGLPPVAVIIAVLAFGELFGFVGILLAVPTSAVLKVVGEVVIARYRRTALYGGETGCDEP